MVGRRVERHSVMQYHHHHHHHHHMGRFDDKRLTRLTISVTQAQRCTLGELARCAGRGVTMGRVARAALDKGLDAVRSAIDQEQAAAETSLPEVQAQPNRREAARLAGQA